MKSIAQASVTGHGTNVIQGLAISLEATALPTIVICAGIIIAFKLAGLYTPGSKNCFRPSTDYPSIRLEIDDGHRQVTVDHYLGCRGVPQGVLDIEKMIEDRTQARYWINQAPAF